MIIIKKYIFLFFLIINFSNIAYSQVVNKIIIEGNERLSTETISIFSKVSINDNIDTSKLNEVLKDIYSTGFFQDVKIEFNNNILKIKVIENPIIQNIIYEGVKSKTILEDVTKNLKLKERSSFNEDFLRSDKIKIIDSLKDLGYFFSKVEVFKEELEDKKVNISYIIDLGNKAKIKKISFIGNKGFKDNKLKRIIVSEEYKFWKFISGRKFLNEKLTQLDTRLLKNYYLNKGFYNVKIDTSFAKLIDENNFELIFNIDSGDKIFFNELKLNLPTDFNSDNFKNLENVFIEIKDEPYSLYGIEKILNQIDEITLNDEYKSINAYLSEEIIENKINITFNIEKSTDFFVEKINIFGNSVTKESVIRNKFLIDEGDPYNEILKNKTVNNLKSLNYFKTVNADVIDGKKDNSKIINISVEEQATGEISASAGFGTSENNIGFTVRENNFLGKGISLDSNLILSTDSIKGLFSVNNPNFLNSDKSLSFYIRSF